MSTVNICNYVCCNHASKGRLARVVAALTPWTFVACCRCKRSKLVRQTTPIVKS